MTQYRIIHFVPDRVQGARFPIAAALRVEDGVQLVINPNQPGPRCLGSDQRAAALALLRQSLRVLESFDALPDTLAPHAVYDDVQHLPVDVRSKDAVAWVRDHVLRRVMADAPTSERRHSHHRASYGSTFFQRWGVRQYVRSRFSPSIDAASWHWPEKWTKPLPVVSHWIASRGKLLLMEPVVPLRDTFEHDVREIGRDFLAYRAVADHIRHDHEPELIAYVLRGGNRDALEFVTQTLGAAPHRVIDASSDSQAEGFTKRIRELGEFAEPGMF